MKLSKTTPMLSAALLSLSLVACGGGSTDGTVGGTVTGMNSGGSVILQNNNADNLTVTGNTPFTFATRLPSLAAFSVTVLTQPVGQTCAVTGATGVIPNDGSTANRVAVTCALSSSVGGTVSGLAAGTSVILNNAGTQLNVAQNGLFAFPGLLTAGTAYEVSIATQPAGQTCTVVNATGTAANGVEGLVTVNCI